MQSGITTAVLKGANAPADQRHGADAATYEGPECNAYVQSASVQSEAVINTNPAKTAGPQNPLGRK